MPTKKRRRPPDLTERWNWFSKVLWWFALPLFFLAGVTISGLSLAPSYSALLGHGEPGIFIADHRVCQRACTWKGTFISSDGSDVRPNVSLAQGGTTPRHKGDRIPVLDTGDHVLVFPRHGSWAWLLVTILFLSFVGFSISWIRSVATDRRRKIGIQSMYKMFGRSRTIHRSGHRPKRRQRR